MRILKIDRREGLLRLSLQTLEDLWHLHKVLEEGDFVRAKTYRKTAIKRGSEVVEGEKKPVNLTIRLEKSDFHVYTGKLRLSGIIISGPEDIQLASHHTITVEPGMVITLKKEQIKSYHIERLERAKVKEANIFFVALDRDRADFAGLREYGLEIFGSLSYKKIEGEEDRDPFYQKIVENLEQQKDYGKIVLCGPGFERENLLAYIKKHASHLAQRIILEHASEIGKPGIQEVIKTSADRILKDTRIVRETAFVEQLLLKIKKNELAVYGKEQTHKAIEYGALDTLMISDVKVKDFEPLIEEAEKISSTVVIISTEHQAGEQLLGLGGIAGFLRFRI